MACAYAEALNRANVELQRPGVRTRSYAVRQHESIRHLSEHFLAMAAGLSDRAPIPANLGAGIRHGDTSRFEDRQAVEDRDEIAGTAVGRHAKPRSGGGIAITASHIGFRYHQLLRLILDLHHRVRSNERAYRD